MLVERFLLAARAGLDQLQFSNKQQQPTKRNTTGCCEVIAALISDINTSLDTLKYEAALMSLVNILRKICLISISYLRHSTKKEFNTITQ